jgi:hypothetical protein
MAAGGPAASGPGAGTGPNPITTRHPSILPLRVEGGRVVHGAGEGGEPEGVLMERLAPLLAPNARDSPPNGLVFGIASASGPVSQLDAAIGSVRGEAGEGGRGRGASCPRSGRFVPAAGQPPTRPSSCASPLLTPCPPAAQLKFKRFLACARNKLWWMTPEWGAAMGALPPETQFLLLELEEPGTYGLVLPLIDGDFRATLRPNK